MAVVGEGRAATGFAIASAIPSLRSGQCRRFASLTAALRIPHAISHQLSLVAIHIFLIIPPL